MDIHNKREMEEIITSYPLEKRYILAIMQDMQKKYNYLPRTGLELIAEYINVPLSRVYSMVTFYKAFSLVPKGRINFKVCDGTACHIKGSQLLIDEIYDKLGIRPGETTADGEFSLETVNCVGACSIAPVLVANEKVYPKVTPSAMRKIIKDYGGHFNETESGK